jgi:hypothetical protein
MFQIKLYRLPHEGVIPGARGHKKRVIPAGTKVYCIAYGTLIYWCAYLKEDQALRVLQGLTATVTKGARRYIPIETLVEWNFSWNMPRRICRD